MATPLCAAATATLACRLSVPSSAGASGLRRSRACRGVVAVRAEAEAAAGGSGINPAIRKEEAKVVDTVLAGELSKPLTPYCRCAALFASRWMERSLNCWSCYSSPLVQDMNSISSISENWIPLEFSYPLKAIAGAGDRAHFHFAMEAM